MAAPLNCPKCHAGGDSIYEGEWDDLTDTDRASARATMHSNMRARTPHELAVKAAIFGISQGAKWTFSKVYHCIHCSHDWRKWF